LRCRKSERIATEGQGVVVAPLLSLSGHPPYPWASLGPFPMSQLHNLRLRLLVQQETEQIAASQPEDLDLALVQARGLCWLALLADAHEQQATDAERAGDVEQAMGWFADAMRLRDVIQVVSSIEVPPAQDLEDGRLAA
jgi:hypothetical protein